MFSILLVQLWSYVAEATHSKQYNRIKDAMKNLSILLIPTAIVLAIMVNKFDLITKIWLGKSINVNNNLVILSAIYSWIICFNGIFTNIQNGMSKIRVQTFSSIVSCVLNIPLAYIFIKVFNLGIIGVMLSNIICLSIASIMCSIDVFIRVLKRKKI